ncbi:MAG: hypothetical protein ACI9UJ_002570 [bacterium]|jgi:hypothetical protein
MKNKFLKAAFAGLVLGVSSYANASIIEDFETGTWGSDWSQATGSISGSAAHDGNYGVSDPGWNIWSGFTVSAGDSISAWFTGGGSGRFYLGFDALPTGADSFVADIYGKHILFQTNAGYRYGDVAETSQVWNDQWYRFQLDVLSTFTVKGSLFDSDGSTLLNTLSHTFSDEISGGVAIRAFRGVEIDTICINGCEAESVPEPSILSLMGLGIVGIGLVRRRRAQS